MRENFGTSSEDWNALSMVFRPSVGSETVESNVTDLLVLVLQFPNGTSGLCPSTL